MSDPDHHISEAATEALSNAMYRYTFGIVGHGLRGAEGQGLGTGVGMFWENTYMIVTAAHTIEITPYEQLYFLLPDESLQFQGSSITPKLSPIAMRKEEAIPTVSGDLAVTLEPEYSHA